MTDIPSIEYELICAQCQSPLSLDASHYVCPFCQSDSKMNHAFCTECADQELKNDEDIHPHGLLLIQKGSIESLHSIRRLVDATSLVPKSYPTYETLKALREFFNVQCNVCRKDTITDYRWMCVNCDEYDLCTNCLRNSDDPIDKEEEKGKENDDKSENEDENKIEVEDENDNDNNNDDDKARETLNKKHCKSHIFQRIHYMMMPKLA